MTHQPMPRTGRGPSVDDCLALSAYWEAEAARPEANSETVLVALAEAKHWRDVAKELKLLMQATPAGNAEPGESGRRRLFRAGQANVKRFLYPSIAQRQPRR
ncbi:MAG: hypothetical protein WCE63_05930 [Acidobacteriaceae bacterium]